MDDLKNISRDQLKEIITKKQYPAYTANQLFQWIYKKRCEHFDDMTDLSHHTRDTLKEMFFFSKLNMLRNEESADGTMKFLFELDDLTTIETVFIPEDKRSTLCVSTQVGCGRGCRFCVSGTLGLSRNLTVSEIINQYLAVSDFMPEAKISNVVFMGVGEPLDNFDNVLSAIRILQDTQGIALPARKTCVSTIGITPAIADLNRTKVSFKLSVSLHCADEEKRNALMPATKKYPLTQLITQLKVFAHKTKMPVTFEYILIDTINSSPQDARALVALARKLPCKVNLIPYNSSSYVQYKPPSSDTIRQFQHILKKDGIVCTLRKSRGGDISAACGQLKAQFKRSG